MSRRSGTCLRLCLVIFAVVSALGVCGPALYWRFKKTLRLGDSKSSCPPCICDCPPPLSLLKIAPGITPLLYWAFYYYQISFFFLFVILACRQNLIKYKHINIKRIHVKCTKCSHWSNCDCVMSEVVTERLNSEANIYNFF